MLQEAKFFRAVISAAELPKNSAEVIFSGRSNVGKSSVINALCCQKNLARTSKTPGRTRSINVYSISMGKWLIDLPGYGFARVSPVEKKLWGEMIENCIVVRNSKKTVYMIIDAFVGPTELDLTMADWLSNQNVPFKIIANKCDKLPKTISETEIQNKVLQTFNTGAMSVFTVSAKTKNGFSGLRLDILKFLNKKNNHNDDIL
ncbi:MAG: ribosome biogenesis GTP-binding protein YihA/YsxC [Elusimicrobiota bacterium]|jgi:GTP-binding protein|nr:ribosome biogenesis GTP-binding protein YihA/YsxC [Elusimicrobiota bacterium]